MVKVKMIAELEVLACASVKDRDGKAQTTKDGKALYECAYKDKEEKEIAGQKFPSDIVSKIKSLLELKPGKHHVELEQFAMSEKDTTKVQLHYRIIGLVK